MKFKPMTTDVEYEWFRARTFVCKKEEQEGIVVYDRRGIQGICVAEAFTSDSCHIHWALDSPFALRSGFLNEIFRHLYQVRMRHHIFVTIPSDNKKSLVLTKHIGFHEVNRMLDGVGTGTDYIIMRMDKDMCRWIVQEEKRSAA